MSDAIGFIGLGKMGAAICHTLVANNVSLCVHNRTEDKALSLIECGATWAADIEKLSGCCNIIFICTSGSDAIKDFFYDSNIGLLSCLKLGSIVVDLSTISPQSATSLYSSFAERGFDYIECPVSGGVEGALAGTLSAIVSGREQAYFKVLPLLNKFCKTTSYVKEPGKAQRLKLLNNLAESINLAGAIEVIKLGQAQGLDLESMVQVFRSCRGRSAYMDVALEYALSNGRSSNVSLAVRCKDLDLAEEQSGNQENYPFATLATSTFHKVKDVYGDDNDQCQYFSLLTQKQ